MNFHRLKKALITSVFFIACLFSSSSYSLNAFSCSNFHPTETATIRYVHDGDTVHLNDNRKVRLIGIDTPELARRHKNQNLAADAYAKEARDYARDLIRHYGNQVRLMPGTERTDHYDRKLFHIQLSDGSSLQSRLLQAGLAVAFTTPPNQQLKHCYQSAEAVARKNNNKIWTLEKYRNIAANKLTLKHHGFHIVQGKIKHIGESKKAFWLNFYSNFSSRIDKRDLKYFPFALNSLLEKEISVRGWLRHYNDNFQMSLRDASAIQVISP